MRCDLSSDLRAIVETARMHLRLGEAGLEQIISPSLRGGQKGCADGFWTVATTSGLGKLGVAS